MARQDAREQEHKTTFYKALAVPATVLPKARPEFQRQARLFRNITEYQAGDGIANGGIACAFEYRAKDRSWQWGWAPHEAIYLLQTWFRQTYKALDQQDAIRQAFASLDQQHTETTARYGLMTNLGPVHQLD